MKHDDDDEFVDDDVSKFIQLKKDGKINEIGPHEAEVTGRADTTGVTSHSLTSSERMNTDEIMFQ